MEATAELDELDVQAPGEAIRIRGARVHNLQSVDVDIPRDRLVVVTGVSGSGKSSLAFDTLFAEGQRQYIESLSTSARQFIDQLQRPDVDSIDGLQPTLSIQQQSGSRNPRSTVATATEIYDYMRLLFARVGTPHCPECDAPIRQQSPEQVQQRLLALPEGTRALLLAPVVRSRRGAQAEAFANIRKWGFVRARVDGVVYDLEQVPELAPRKMHTVEAVVDRIVVREKFAPRIAESIDLAIRHGEGTIVVAIEQQGDGGERTWRDETISTHYACPNCSISFEELQPRTFSFNSPHGACPACDGLGCVVRFDPDLVVGSTKQSLEAGATAAWATGSRKEVERRRGEVEPWLDKAGLKWDTPLEHYSPKQLHQLLEGDGREFLGVLVLLEKEFATATRPTALERLEAFRGETVCPECDGARLRPEARGVKIGSLAIHQVAALDVRKARTFFTELKFADPADESVAAPISREIERRLAFLEKVGLDYLSLDRRADTLSGGEHQRVRLATSIGTGLTGVCYVLDEPSIGLHPRDNDRLIEALRDLQTQGATVVVVEHDEAMMRAADHLIDVGPGAGKLGGRIVAAGSPEEVCETADSLTGDYLSGRRAIEIPAERRKATKSKSIAIEGVTTNNLQNVSTFFPLGALTCVTGVSGSGKSSLVNETLARALARRLGGGGPKPGPHASLRGVSQIERAIQVDQAPIGRTPRSNPATFTGVFDEIRKVFAATKQAKQRGFRAGRFSFNNKGGRCEECQGQGQKKLEMQFLPDLYVPCPACKGDRFNRQTLEVRYRGRSIADVLATPIDEAAEVFENFPLISRSLRSLQDVGLGYLALGQPSTTLSGGEAQRVKLATELARVDSSGAFYILDEPTTGLHLDDVRRLLGILSRLVDRGATVVVIEHHLDVIKSADWIIDVGPEGGAAGGRIVAVGPPEEIVEVEASHTGRALRGVLCGGE